MDIEQSIWYPLCNPAKAHLLHLENGSPARLWGHSISERSAWRGMRSLDDDDQVPVSSNTVHNSDTRSYNIERLSTCH